MCVTSRIECPMLRSRFVKVTNVAIALILLPLVLLVSGCSVPNRSGSEPGTATTPWDTPTPVSAPQPNSNEAMERANVQGTGVYVTKGVRQLTGLQWSFETQDSGEITSPAIQGSTVYFSQHGRVYAVDTATGTEKWKRNLDIVGTSAPAVADDTVYIGGLEQFYALSADTGGLKWGFPAKQGADVFLQAPTVVDGTVYVGGENNFYALDSKTGQEKWEFKMSGWVRSVPAVYDGTVYIGTFSVFTRSSTYNDTYLYALDSKTGQEKWKVNVPDGGFIGSVAVADGIVYMSSSEDVRALDAKSGQEKWRYTAGLVVPGAPAVAYGMVYVTAQGRLHAIDAQTGNEKWQVQGTTGLSSDPVIADGVVYLATADNAGALFGGEISGNLVAVDAQSGQKLWNFSAKGILRVPAVADGTIYFGSDAGTFYAVR
jgi:outer membrane protein assembly factor BamB